MALIIVTLKKMKFLRRYRKNWLLWAVGDAHRFTEEAFQIKLQLQTSHKSLILDIDQLQCKRSTATNLSEM